MAALRVSNALIWHPTGEASDIEIQARETIALKRRMEELIAQHSGQPLEKVAEDMERDYFLSAENAVVYGIIDRVLTHRLPEHVAIGGSGSLLPSYARGRQRERLCFEPHRLESQSRRGGR